MANKLSFSIAINILTEQFKRGANQVKSAFDGMKKQILGFAAVLGIGGMGLRNFIETTSAFESSISKLSAILGTTPDKIKALTENAKKLGETTKYTAAEAANLQIELAKLGFTKNEILSTTESVLKFAQATDAGLAEAAALAGASLRMFGAEASESKRYVSAMSIATTKSALSFNYLAAALPTVGPVAKAFNFTIEDTMALLGKLADSGFDASSAATATRNILLNLADSGGKLATALGGPVKTLPELVSGLQKLKDKGVDLNTTLQLTDKRSVAAFNAFLQSADSIVPLREAITGVEGDLDQMASTMGDNIKGAMAGLGSAWEALIIKLSESTNGPLKYMINWFTQLLRDIKSGFSGLVAFVITLVSGKLIQVIGGFFKTQWNFITTTVSKAKIAEEQKLLLTQKRIEAEKVLEATKTAYETTENGKRLASKSQLAKAEKALNAASLAEKRAIDAAKIASDKAAALQTTSIWGKTANTIKLAWAKVAITLKSLWSAVWPMALITAIGAVIGKLVNMRKEAKRIKSIFSDYNEAAKGIQSSTEIAQLEALRNIVNDVKKSENERKKALEEISKRLNIIQKKNESEIDYQKRINDKIKDRIKLLEESARADFYAQQKVSAEHEFNKIKNTLGLQGMLDGNMESMMSNMARYKDTGSRKALQKGINVYAEQIRGSGGKFTDNYQDKLVEMSNYWQIMVDSSKEIANAVNNSLKLNTSNTDIDTDKYKEKQTPLQKAEEEYRTSLQNYKNQLESGAITQNKYNEEIDKLNSDTVVKLGGILGKSADANEIYVSALLGTLNPRVTESEKAQAELVKVQEEFQTSVSLAKVKLDKKLISEDEYRQAIIDAALAAANSAVSIEKIGDAADNFVKEMQGVIGENLQKNFQMPKLRQRDTTFDYKKTETDKLSEKVDIWIEYRDNLKEKLNGVKDKTSDLAKEIQTELNSAIQNTNDFEKALKIAQVRQDMKDFSKELNESLYSGVKNIASSSDRMVSAFENLRDVFDDVDSSGWERIMAVWNAMTNTIDGIMSICKTIETLTELTNKLAKAKEVEAVIDKATADEKVVNAAKGSAATIAESQVEQSAATTEVAANTAKGASEAGASAAKLPFPWNIVAIGGAIAAAIAAFAVIPKFASGGIIAGGPTSGDKILARVNAGEMILNGRQQSNLFEAINSGKLNSMQNQSVSIGFDKVRGSDIYLSLKNYMKSTNKKL